MADLRREIENRDAQDPYEELDESEAKALLETLRKDMVELQHKAKEHQKNRDKAAKKAKALEDEDESDLEERKVRLKTEAKRDNHDRLHRQANEEIQKLQKQVSILEKRLLRPRGSITSSMSTRPSFTFDGDDQPDLAPSSPMTEAESFSEGCDNT